MTESSPQYKNEKEKKINVMKDRQAIVTGKEFTLLKFTTGVFYESKDTTQTAGFKFVIDI